MALSRLNNTNANDASDHIYRGDEAALRYLGHDRAAYGFVLFTPSKPNGDEFIFPLNPQSIEQEEEAAITITPTQGGGKFIENQGNIFKDIVISGTTGFLPTRNLRGVAGAALLQQAAARLTGQDTANAQSAFAGVSGYHSFQTLRSLFRNYLQIHRTGGVEVRRKTTLFWVNLKDDEAWLVEPMSFRMSRASRSPMTYGYTIRLRTIAKGAAGFVPADTSSHAPVAAESQLRSLVAIRDRIAAANALLRGALSFFDQYRNLRSLVVSILDVGTDLSAQLTKITAGAADVLDLPRSILYSATSNVTSVFEGISNASDLIANVPIDALEGLTTTRQQFDFILAKKELFEKKWSNSWNAATANFSRSFGLSGDASDFLNDGRNRSGLAEATPSGGESVYQFALRVAGDPMRAHEIIVLNNLKWPYFSPSADERTPGTVAPGDPLLVPVDFTSNANDNLVRNTVGRGDRTYKDEVNTATAIGLTKLGLDLWRVDEWEGFSVEMLSGAAVGQTRLIVANTSLGLTVDKPWTIVPNANEVFRIFFKRVTRPPRAGIVELLGVDLRIAFSARFSTWDLVRESNGDLSTIRGEDNLHQALSTKFLTSEGELVLHPWFGLKPVFGRRGTPEALFRLRLFFEQTLLSDSRIEAVESLALHQEADRYVTEARLSVKGGLHSMFVSPLV